MPLAVRFTDICTGHCFTPRSNDQASDNVIINNLGAHRKTDHWPTHCCGSCHDGVAAKGSPNVFTNNLDQMRVGDPISCGSACAQGSPNVIVN